MIAMRMMQVALYEIIGVIAVRDRLVSASRPMNVPGFVAAAFVPAGAIVWIFRGNFNAVFLDPVSAHMMKMAVVEIVDVASMAYCRMAAPGFVTMGMMVVLSRGRHPVALLHIVPGEQPEP